MASEPSGPEQNKPAVKQQRGWWITAGLLALLLVAGLVVLWVQAPVLYGRGDAAGAGLYMTTRTLAETQRANQASDEREREAQVTDRYTKAIEQLGNKDSLDVRLGGIYALERIAVDSIRDHPTVVEVLSAFVREHSWPTTSPMLLPIERSRVQAAEHPPARARQVHAATPRPATDVQAAVSVLGRLPVRPDVPRADLHQATLTGANLGGADLTGTDLFWATLTGANLAMAKNLTQQQLDSARGNEDTQLPAGLQRPAHWSSDPAPPPTAGP